MRTVIASSIRGNGPITQSKGKRKQPKEEKERKRSIHVATRGVEPRELSYKGSCDDHMIASIVKETVNARKREKKR